jgi:hypothetical protein
MAKMLIFESSTTEETMTNQKNIAIYRTQCAGCNVELPDAQYKKTEKLFKELGGEVGYVSDKSVELIFKNSIDRDRFVRFSEKLGAIFD